MDNQVCLFRAAYEWPKTGTRGRVTFVASRQEALPFAAEYVNKCVKGYLMSLVELRPAQVQEELKLM